jgi:hypothetical protein
MSASNSNSQSERNGNGKKRPDLSSLDQYDLKERKLKAEIEEREAKADRARLDNAARAGLLVSAATAQRVAVQHLAHALDAMVADLGDLAAATDGPLSSRREVLGQWLNRHMVALADRFGSGPGGKLSDLPDGRRARRVAPSQGSADA